MKKTLCILLALICGFSSFALGESARDYALWLEKALPEYHYSDADVPEFVTSALGSDYDFAARIHEKDGLYIAGVRREDAPQLPPDLVYSYNGTFETRVFRAEDENGQIHYEFILADGVYMQAYDNMQHLVIWLDPEADAHSEFQKAFYTPQTMIFNAADSQYRARLDYAAKKGFTSRNKNNKQLLFYIHNPETWTAGITREPTGFYMDITPPEDILGESYLSEEELIQHTRIPIGLYLYEGETEYSLVLSESGVPGVEIHDPHRLYEVGTGYNALVDRAEEVLGYRPGKVDFLGKTSKRATLEWNGGYTTIAIEENLRRLDAMLNHADFTIGSVNCPSPCFLTVEYTDGSSASMAVAVNSFNLFFYNGLYFTAGNGELLDIFMLKAEDIYV